MGKKINKKKELLKQQRETNKNRWKNIAKVKDNSVSDPVSEAIENVNIMEIPKGAKSSVKALGVKSTFAVGNEIIMTSFGRGNDAVLEKRIEGVNHYDLNDKTSFEIKSIEDKGKKINVIKRRFKGPDVEAAAEKPSKIKGKGGDAAPGNDAIQCRPVLEKKYFGKNFDDNIHIQLIYNILDIEKILAVYSNNIVFALNNAAGDDLKGTQEFIGNISTRFKYENYGINETQKKFMSNYLKNPKLGYFGNTFYSCKQVGKKKVYSLKPEEEIYNILALMGSIRQVCFHEETHGLKEVFEKSSLEGGWLYNLDDVLDEEFKDVLNSVYKTDVIKALKGFLSNSGVDLNIIIDIFNTLRINSKPEQLAGDFYDFKILKKQKNLGFSAKKLREEIMTYYEAEAYQDKSYDSVRSKLYKVLDFIIYFHYIHYEQDKAEDMVAKLRASFTDTEKDKIYKNEANRIFKGYMKTVITSESVSGIKNKEVLKNDEISSEISEALKNSTKVNTNISYFCKLVYLACKLLDGKEINDLLTTLISKFDNIRSYIDTLNELKLDSSFVSEFKFFENSKKICEELNEVKSFARMCKPNISAKKLMYKDAMYILGTDKTEAELDKEADRILGVDENGNIRTDVPKDFRNFIAKNVIESNRFKYLVKYANPKKIRKLAENRNVVGFAVNRLPDTQIDRYCESCHISLNGLESRETKVNELVEIIHGINFENFKGVKTNVSKLGFYEKKEANLKKEQYQAVISLYLTILYIIVKNLINVNSRYVIAIHMLERDLTLNGIDFDDNGKKNLALVKLYVEDFSDDIGGEDLKICIRGKEAKYICQNKPYINLNIFKTYRNAIAHLSVIRNVDELISDTGSFGSYFGLYHFLMQCWLYKTFDNNGWKGFTKIKPLLEKTKKYKTCCKDCVKALNIPFGYNLARYKNLSIDELFDENDDRKSRVK